MSPDILLTDPPKIACCRGIPGCSPDFFLQISGEQVTEAARLGSAFRG
jgi:hypothetical protein